MIDYDICDECAANGDDYFINDEGELECACSTCRYCSDNYDDDWDD